MTDHARLTVDCDVRPSFTACYLRVAGDECAFIEAHTAHAVPRLLASLAARSLSPESVRWVVITHAHLDHAGGAGALMKHLPNATLLAHPRAAKHLVDPEKLIAGATEVYGRDRMRQLYGVIEPVPAGRVRALEDGETFELGDATLRVHHTAGHAWHHFVVEDPRLSTVYTGDAFGLVYPELQRGARFALPSTSPTGFHAEEARKSLDLVVGLGMEAACLTHFDEVTDLADVAAQLRALIDRSEAWVEEAARRDEPLAAMTARLASEQRATLVAAAAARGLALTAQDLETLALDIELNAQGLAYVADKQRAARLR